MACAREAADVPTATEKVELCNCCAHLDPMMTMFLHASSAEVPA